MGIFKKKKEKSTSKPSTDFSSGVDTSEFYTKKKKKSGESKYPGVIDMPSLSASGEVVTQPLKLPSVSLQAPSPTRIPRQNIDMEKQTKKFLDPAHKLLKPAAKVGEPVQELLLPFTYLS